MADTTVSTRQFEAVFDCGDGVGPVDFTIEAGESVLVIGPSGSGKSTLLRILIGAVPHAIPAQVTGDAVVGGMRVADHSIAELARVAGVVMQHPESGVCLTHVEDEIALPLENAGVEPGLIDVAVTTALARVDAEHLRHRATTELSGGELQRIAVAAAIATRPPLLVLDEPTAMLDAPGVRTVQRVVERVRAETGAACIVVEHRLDELAGEAGLGGLPPRWLVLSDTGRVVFDGAPHKLDLATLRSLVGSGCWLPLELELRAVLDEPDEGGPERKAVEHAQRAQFMPSTHLVGEETLQVSGLAVAGEQRRRTDRVCVLTDVNFTLRTGEVVALVGANGSGKSSLLACLAGVAHPVEGRVEGPRAGLVFQNPEHQFAESTVARELAHGIVGCSDERVAAMLEAFALGDLADRNPFRLSGGQQRRLSLAAMLMHERPFLLADEPTFGLDRRGAIGTMRMLRQTAAAGRGVLFTSHDARMVVAYSDRVIVVGHGRIVADTTPLEFIRDGRLLAAAGMHPSSLLRQVARASESSAEARHILQHLDGLAFNMSVAARQH